MSTSDTRVQYQPQAEMIAADGVTDGAVRYLQRYLHFLSGNNTDEEYDARVVLFLKETLSVLEVDRMLVLPYITMGYGSTTFGMMASLSYVSRAANPGGKVTMYRWLDGGVALPAAVLDAIALAMANPTRRYVLLIDHITDSFEANMFKVITFLKNKSGIFDQPMATPAVLDAAGNVLTTYYPTNLALVATEGAEFNDPSRMFRNMFFDKTPTGWDTLLTDGGLIGSRLYANFLEDTALEEPDNLPTDLPVVMRCAWTVRNARRLARLATL